MIAFLLTFAALGGLYKQMSKRPETRALMVLALIVLVIGIVFYTTVEGWSLLDAAYFCVVTLGTVGYGDITPTTSLGKLFTMGYIVVGLGIIGGFFGTIGRVINPEAFLQREKERFERPPGPQTAASESTDHVP